MDSNVLLAIVIIGACIAGFLYLRKHGIDMKSTVQSAAADVQSHVSGVVAAAQSDLQRSVTTAAIVATRKPLAEPAGDGVMDRPLSPGAATPTATVAQNDASSTQAAVAVPAALEPSTTPEQPPMRLAFTPSYIQMTAQPDAAGVVNIPWPLVPHIGVICNGVPSNPGAAGLRFRFKPGVMRKPVGTLKFSGSPELTAWDVSLVDAATGAVVAAMPGNWLHFVVDVDPAQSDWYRLDSTIVYDAVAKRRTAEVALEDSRFELEN